jgi:hypothetical protein
MFLGRSDSCFNGSSSTVNNSESEFEVKVVEMTVKLAS